MNDFFLCVCVWVTVVLLLVRSSVCTLPMQKKWTGFLWLSFQMLFLFSLAPHLLLCWTNARIKEKLYMHTILDSLNGSSYVVLDTNNSKAPSNKEGITKTIFIKCIFALNVGRNCLWNDRSPMISDHHKLECSAYYPNQWKEYSFFMFKCWSECHHDILYAVSLYVAGRKRLGWSYLEADLYWIRQIHVSFSDSCKITLSIILFCILFPFSMQNLMLNFNNFMECARIVDLNFYLCFLWAPFSPAEQVIPDIHGCCKCPCTQTHMHVYNWLHALSLKLVLLSAVKFDCLCLELDLFLTCHGFFMPVKESPCLLSLALSRYFAISLIVIRYSVA